MNFGTYTLGESITSYDDLTEFSSLEYKIVRKTFLGEHIFKAPSCLCSTACGKWYCLRSRTVRCIRSRLSSCRSREMR